jgi:Tfp pilus assembly protein PilV
MYFEGMPVRSEAREVSEKAMLRPVILEEGVSLSSLTRCPERRAPWNKNGVNTDSGAVLILALIYIVVVSVIVLALSGWATNDLKNTTKFSSANSTNSAATGAADVALQSMRYNPIPAATPTGGTATPYGECWTPASGSVSQLTVDSVAIQEWCSTTENLASPQTRIVTIDSCVSSSGTSVCGNPWLVIEVAFNDYPPGGLPLLTTQCNLASQPTCGEGMTIQSWVWS